VLKVPAGDEFLRRLRLGTAKLDLTRAFVEENGLAIAGMEQVDCPPQAEVVIVAVEDQNSARTGWSVINMRPLNLMHNVRPARTSISRRITPGDLRAPLRLWLVCRFSNFSGMRIVLLCSCGVCRATIDLQMAAVVEKKSQRTPC